MTNVKHLGVVVVIMVLMIVVLYGANAQDDFTDDYLEGDIVFTAGHYWYDLYLLSGGEIIPITNETNQYTKLRTPRWSPNGDRIAFIDEENVYIIDADGSNLVQLTDDVLLNPWHLDWSPDGQIIAIVFDQSPHIRLLDIDTLEVSDLMLGNYRDGLLGLSWSPDGEYIVFTSNRDGERSGLYTIEISSGEVAMLLNMPYHMRYVRHPRWSPNGEQIAFTNENYDGGRDIYLINVDGSDLTRLTNQTNAPGISNHIGQMSWSPDGDRIVFSACPPYPIGYPEGCELYMIGVDGAGFVQLTDNEEKGAFSPDWRPVPAEDPVVIAVAGLMTIDQYALQG